MGNSVNISGSYYPHETKGGLDAELERLEAQVSVSWEKEFQVLKRLGLRDGMKILEQGCGPGFVTEKLPENEFDFVIARYLYQHIADPVLAVRATLPVLKEGGTLAVIDVDAGLWGMSHPFRPDLIPIYMKADQLQSSRQGDRAVGRKLWKILAKGGFSEPLLDIFSYHSDDCPLESFAPILNPYRLHAACSAGLISTMELNSALDAFDEFLIAPDAYVLMLGFIASAKK